MECIKYDENSRSGGVAAVDNGSVLVCKPYIHYRTFVCKTELKRRAANYSETLRARGGVIETVLDFLISQRVQSLFATPCGLCEHRVYVR